MDHLVGISEVLEVECNGEPLAPLTLDGFDGVVSVGLFLGEVDDSDICAFAREEDRDSAPDTRASGSRRSVLVNTSKCLILLTLRR